MQNTKLNTLDISVWWSNGTMMYRRECLPANHPEQMYNYIKREFKVDPEDYGVYHPVVGNIEEIKTLEQARKEIAQLRTKVHELKEAMISYERYL